MIKNINILILSLIVLNAFNLISQNTVVFEEKIKNQVSNYINSKLNEGDVYEPVGFSEITVIKPYEFAVLEELEFANGTKIGTKNIKEEIEELEEYIETNNISYIFEINHVFLLYNNFKKIDILEITYRLNDTFEVINFNPIIMLNTAMFNRTMFLKYYNNIPIFKTANTYENEKLSNQFYGYFKNKLDGISDIEKRSEFLEHILFLINEIYLKGEFKQKEVLMKIAYNFLKDKFKSYNPNVFSKLFEIKNDDILEGYYFFHKFSHSNENIDEEFLVYYLKFSPYYELENYLPMQKPYEKYFTE